MDEFIKKITALINAAPRILQVIAEQYNQLATAYIQSEMNADKQTPKHSFNNSNKLNVNSGNKNSLAFSFDVDSPDSGSKFKISKSGLSGVIGSNKPYAKIHETGGFINSKGNMHKFFWGKYYETKQDFYKWIALSVMKKGGVNIKARPYFKPAMEALKKDGAEIISELLAEEIQAIYDR